MLAKSIIGMIHVPALPGSIYFKGNLEYNRQKTIKELIKRPLAECAIYQAAGADAIILENMHDLPYTKPPLSRNTVEAMTIIAKAVRKQTQLPIGIQMLEAANCEAMEIACSASLDFIRAEGFVYAHIGGAGLIEGSARKILEVRKQKSCPKIKIFADVKKKHCAHALTSDLSVSDIVRQSEFFCTDGIIITGHFTAEPASCHDLKEAKQASPHLPLLIGSGITAENLSDYYDYADGFIVGSYFKYKGNWKNDLDPERVKKLIKVRNHLRNKREQIKSL